MTEENKAEWEEVISKVVHSGHSSESQLMALLPYIRGHFISRSELKERIEGVKIDRAHTYSSENADVYRAYDSGQENMKKRILKILEP